LLHYLQVAENIYLIWYTFQTTVITLSAVNAQ